VVYGSWMLFIAFARSVVLQHTWKNFRRYRCLVPSAFEGTNKILIGEELLSDAVEK